MPRKTRGGDGSFSRRAALLMIGGGGLMAVSGTGSFTQLEADRGFSAETVTDKNALLGIKTFDVTFENKGKKEKILELTNRTSSTLDISISSSHEFLDIVPMSDLTENESGDVMARATEERSDASPIEVTITAESDSVSVTATRSLTVTTDLGPESPEACPVTPRPGISVTVDENAQNTVRNVGSVSRDVDGDVLISNGNDFDITAGSTISISGKISGSSTGNIKLQNDKVGENIMASSGKNVTLKGSTVVKGIKNKPSIETGSGTVKIKHTTMIGAPSSEPSIKTTGGKVKIIGQNQSNIVIISGDVSSSQIEKIQDADVGGDVTATGGGIETQRARIGGAVKTSSGNDAQIKDSIICGTITSDGNVKIKNKSEVKNIKSTTNGKNVKIKNRSLVTGHINIQSGGNVKVKNRSKVLGNITAGSHTKIKIKNRSTVKGDITAGEGSLVKIKATVEGDVTADRVEVFNNGTVKGEITETG